MKDKITYKEILACLIAVLILVGVFFLGFFTRSWTSPQSVNSYEWVVNLIKNNYFMDIDDEDILNATIDQISQNFFDDYSRYYTAEEYREIKASNLGSKRGLGIGKEYIPGRGILVSYVVGNSPAYKAGIKKGMIITSAQSSKGTKSFVYDDDFAEYIDALDDNEEVLLNVSIPSSPSSSDTTSLQFRLAPQKYSATYCYMATNQSTWAYGDRHLLFENTDEKMTFLPDKVAYINISQFYGNAGAEFGGLIEKFNELECESLILDLRGNGGGYVNTMLDVAGYCTSAINKISPYGMIAEHRNKTENYIIPEYTISDKLLKDETEVYIMANMDTASASEALMGVLIDNAVTSYDHVYLSSYTQPYLDYLTAVGVGTAKNGKTYGKGVMQTTYVKPDTGEALKLTTARIKWPLGRCINGVGITADDGCNLVSADWSVTYYDEELKSVVDAIF